MKLYDKVLCEGKDGTRVHLYVNEFLDTEYLHIREHYLSFDEEWMPGKSGICLKLDIPTIRALFSSIVDIMSLAEVEYIMQEALNEKANKNSE